MRYPSIASLLLSMCIALLPGVSMARTHKAGKVPKAAVPAHQTKIGNLSAHALLIGINDYHAPGLNALQSPINDLALTKDLLIKRFGLAESQIHILKDKDATHTGIQRAFEQLTAETKPGEFVYIYYSGHGAVTPDGNGDETLSHQDQTWVPYGARENKLKGLDNWDVLDDEVYAWLSALRAKTDQIVFVSDSCHSGSVSRAPLVEVRYAPKDVREHPLAKQPHKALPFSADNLGIRIGAAVDNDYAYGSDRQNEDNKLIPYGDFTWYWVKALNSTKPGDTWDAVFARTTALMANDTRIRQKPQIAGNTNRTVFGGQFVALPKSVTVTKLSGNNQLSLNAGILSAISQGSTYRPLNSTKTTQQSQACITITQAGLFQSEARYEPQACKLTVGDQLAEVEHRYTLTPIRLQLKADYPNDQDKTLLNQLQTALSTLSGFQLVDNQSPADWVVYVLRPDPTQVKDNPTTQFTGSRPDNPPQAWVIDPQGKLIHPRLQADLSQPEGIRDITHKLSQYAKVQEFLSLSGNGAIPIEITVNKYQPVATCDQPEPTCLKLPGKQQSYQQTGEAIPLPQLQSNPPKRDELLSYFAHNNSDEPVYLYLLNVTPEGGIDNVFPSPDSSQDTARLEGGKQGKESLSLNHYTVFDSQGHNYLKIIATKTPLDHRLFSQAGIHELKRSTPPNPLERYLIGRLASRNGSGSFGIDDWSSQQVGFIVP